MMLNGMPKEAKMMGRWVPTWNEMVPRGERKEMRVEIREEKRRQEKRGKEQRERRRKKVIANEVEEKEKDKRGEQKVRREKRRENSITYPYKYSCLFFLACFW